MKSTHKKNAMVNCPDCKGKGKITVTITEAGKKGEKKWVTDCLTCQGVGKVTKEKNKAYKDYLNMWCECENSPIEAWTFHDDGEHPVIQKHHYRCGICHKITQIG